MPRTTWIIAVVIIMGWISINQSSTAGEQPLSPEVESTAQEQSSSPEAESTAQEQPISPEAESAVHEVRIPKALDKFEPPVLNIKIGDTVKWINEDDRGHPIASIPGQGTSDKELFSAPIAPGKSWSHTFKKAGEYPYFCYIHYVMMGVIIVGEAEQKQPQ